MSGRIVVGVDHSPQARAALAWAVDEALLRDADIEVVHGVNLAPIDDIHYAPEVFEDAGRAILDEVLADVDVSKLPNPPILTVAISSPAGLLIEKSKQAELLVVGARGHGGFGALLLGSVSSQVVHHAACPVVVVR